MKIIKFNFEKGYPVGGTYFYKCKSCGEMIPSQPSDSIGCSCGNIFIDIDYARISVKRNGDIELLEIPLPGPC
jgi:hypothetical protein